MKKRSLRTPSLVVLSALLVATASTASGHEFWIAPTSYSLDPGTERHLLAFVGEGIHGDPIRYSQWGTERMSFRAGSSLEETEVSDLRANAEHGLSHLGLLPAVETSGACITYVSRPQRNELSGSEFDSYLEEDGLRAALTARRQPGASDQPGKELFQRSAVLWIPGNETVPDFRRLELPIQIVPLSDPRRDGPVRVQVLFEGEPLENALVRTWHAPPSRSGLEWSARSNREEEALFRGWTDDRGTVEIELGDDGEWLISAVHMIPATDDSWADWKSYWGSLCFGKGMN